MAMNVAIEIPENVSAPLRSRWKDVPRRVLEAVAAEAYRSGALTAHQVGELLGHGGGFLCEGAAVVTEPVTAVNRIPGRLRIKDMVSQW